MQPSLWQISMQSILGIDPTLFMLIVIFAILVGTVASMLGIGGGTLNTPLLVILFTIPANEASTASLFAAIFASVSSTVSYYRVQPSPIIRSVGIMVAVVTVPGSIIGAWLKTLFEDMTLRYIFAVLLFPLALKMMFAKKRPGVKSDFASELKSFSFIGVSLRRKGYVLFGSFIAGVAAGLLGLGGGAIVVPVLTMAVGLPMHAAVATSMFAMIFTTIAGTATNFLLGQMDLSYAIALSIGMLVGAQIGSPLACRVDAVRLKQGFGVLLILPLVRMAQVGTLLFGPSPIYSTIGDILVWLMIVLPLALFREYHHIRQRSSMQQSESNIGCEPSPGVV